MAQRRLKDLTLLDYKVSAAFGPVKAGAWTGACGSLDRGKAGRYKAPKQSKDPYAPEGAEETGFDVGNIDG